MRKFKGNIMSYKRTINGKTTIIYFKEENWKRIWWNDYTNPVVGFLKHWKTVLSYRQSGYYTFAPKILENTKGVQQQQIKDYFSQHDKAQEIFEKIKFEID